jgi:AcrR family transcriptional regulator
VTSQQERRAQTRRRLLVAAAELFADRGIEAASVDAIAEHAGRTSGAVYDHFGGKEGLLFALFEEWVDDVAGVVMAELIAASSLEERCRALWRNVSDPPTGEGRWMALEHELWLYSIRHEEARRHLAERYRTAWEGAEAAVAGDGTASGAGLVVVALLLGLEMLRRIDPSTVTDEVAVTALRRAVTGHRAAQP